MLGALAKNAILSQRVNTGNGQKEPGIYSGVNFLCRNSNERDPQFALNSDNGWEG